MYGSNPFPSPSNLLAIIDLYRVKVVKGVCLLGCSSPLIRPVNLYAHLYVLNVVLLTSTLAKSLSLLGHGDNRGSQISLILFYRGPITGTYENVLNGYVVDLELPHKNFLGLVLIPVHVTC